MRKERAFRFTQKCQRDHAIHAARALAQPHDGGAAAFDRLLRQVHGRAPALTMQHASLLAFALHHADWLRPVESWRPPAVQPWALLTSLAHHLFARAPVPRFMTSVWFDLPAGERLPQHEWYKHLGRGQSIRTAAIPLRFTRQMAHCFLEAPDHFRVFPALRWAQVRGLGGNERLAHAVLATRLGTTFVHEDYWESVLEYFVRYPALDVRHVGQIVNYVQAQRFGTGDHPVPQPTYTLTGRTVASLLEDVERWQRYPHYWYRRPVPPPPSPVWCRSPIAEFRLIEGSDELRNRRIWTITELVTSQELALEGAAMQHCVGSYAQRCSQKVTSIWSLQVENRFGRRRVLTVEVNLRTNTICQAKRRRNHPPKRVERAVLARWAAEAGLHLSEMLRP